MKNKVRVIRGALLSMLAVVIPVLGSCSHEKTDAGDLLSTVPSSAGMVVGINLRTVLEKAGCKVDGSRITPGEDVKNWIESIAGSTDSQKEAMRMVLSGESGIDPAGAIFFTDAYNGYLTAMLADTGEFMDFVKKQTGNDFTESDGVKVNGNIAVSGAQMWVCVTSSAPVDAKAILSYTGLEQSQSFMSNPFSGKISTMTNDIIGWGQIKSLAGRGMSFTGLSKINLLTGMLFEDASSFSFTCDFLKGKLEGRAEVVDTDGKPAKYLLPASKIDGGEVKGLASTAECVGAISITKDLVKRIEKVSSSLGGNMFGPVLDMLGSVDGTVAVALSSIDNPEDGVSAVVTTDGNPSSELMSLLSQFGPTRKEGKLVKVKSGEVSGTLDVASAADFLKTTTMGIVINSGSSSLGSQAEGMQTMSLGLAPENGSIVLKISATGSNPDENMLLTILKNGK